jgi:hypothetical protein
LPTIVLCALEALLLGLAGVFHGVVRPELRALYQSARVTLPASAALALGPWLLPGGMAISFGVFALGLAHRKRSVRLRWLGVAAGVASACFVMVVWLAYRPMLG